MGYVDIFYWKIAIACMLVGLFFFFATAESLVQGKLKIPAWVFSSFTMVSGIFFFRVFVKSVNEFQVGRHDSIDELIDIWHLVSNFMHF